MPPSRKEPPRFEYDPEEDQYFPVFKDSVPVPGGAPKRPRFSTSEESDDLRMTLRVAGNIVLCGYQNGSIVPVDIRQNRRRHTEHSTRITRINAVQWKFKKLHQSVHALFCFLASLASDDHYFLGSSFDGSIKLFDMRLLQRSVLSYEGHVNSNSLLELAVNSSETHFISGGEDSFVHIWNIKTAELLFEEMFCESDFNAVCWPETDGSYKRQGSEMENWGAWLGSWGGLYYMHGT